MQYIWDVLLPQWQCFKVIRITKPHRTRLNLSRCVTKLTTQSPARSLCRPARHITTWAKFIGAALNAIGAMQRTVRLRVEHRFRVIGRNTAKSFYSPLNEVRTSQYVGMQRYCNWLYWSQAKTGDWTGVIVYLKSNYLKLPSRYFEPSEDSSWSRWEGQCQNCILRRCLRSLRLLGRLVPPAFQESSNHPVHLALRDARVYSFSWKLIVDSCGRTSATVVLFSRLLAVMVKLQQMVDPSFVLTVFSDLATVDLATASAGVDTVGCCTGSQISINVFQLPLFLVASDHWLTIEGVRKLETVPITRLIRVSVHVQIACWAVVRFSKCWLLRLHIGKEESPLTLTDWVAAVSAMIVSFRTTAGTVGAAAVVGMIGIGMVAKTCGRWAVVKALVLFVPRVVSLLVAHQIE